MLVDKSFFPAVCTHNGSRIHIFGGYEPSEKVQLTACEYYDITQDKWQANDQIQLQTARS